MEIVNISFVLILLCSLETISGMSVLKSMAPTPENGEDRTSGETTLTPEATNVRTKKPETDSLNDAAEPQLPENLKEPELPLSDSPLIKRSEVVGSTQQKPLSVSRRDLTERRLQQCEICRNGKLCKNHNVCLQCKAVCKDMTATTPDSTIETIPLQGKREITIPTVTAAPVTTSAPNLIVGSRFKEEEKSMPRYYSIGKVENEPVMRLFSKIFHVPENFENFIVLGKIKGSTEEKDFDSVMIIDLAQVFGTDKKTKVTLHRFENSDPANVRLVNELNSKLDEILSKKMNETGTNILEKDEINNVINEAMKEVSNSVGNPQDDKARCNLDEFDEAVDELIQVLPPAMQERAKASLHHERMPSVVKPQPEVFEEGIKNPPVIQDNFNVGTTQETSGIVQEPSLENIPSELITKTLMNVKPPKPENLVGEMNNDPGLPQTVPEEVRNVVRDSLKIVDVASPLSSLPQTVNPTVGEINNAPVSPSGLPEEVRDVIKDSLKISDVTRPISSVPQTINPTVGEINNTPVSPSGLPEEVRDVIRDSLKIADVTQPLSSLPQVINPTIGESNIAPSSPTESLSEKVKDIIRDSVKIAEPLSSFRQPAYQVSESNSLEKAADKQNAPSNDLAQNVLKVVEDSLKPVSNTPNLLSEANTVGESNPLPEEQPTLSQINTPVPTAPKEFQTAEPSSQLVGEQNPEITVPTKTIAEDPIIVPTMMNAKMTESNVESRSQFTDAEKSNYFGSLVPTKDLAGITDPRMKKVLYVGDNMNLPLKMFQDTDGTIKLRVDTDALCSCKNTTCTKKHMDETFRSVVMDEHEGTEIPQLQVRFNEDTKRSEDMMENFMESLHNNHENRGIFKRSTDDETRNEIQEESIEVEKLEIENEIEKLTEDIEKYKEANKNLLNRGTLALFKDIEKTKEVEKIMTLANNFLLWMKEFAMKRLEDM